MGVQGGHHRWTWQDTGMAAGGLLLLGWFIVALSWSLEALVTFAR
jgi:hypothetical protein